MLESPFFLGGGSDLFFDAFPSLVLGGGKSLSGNQVHSCFVFNYDMNDMMRRVTLEIL